MSIKDLFEEIKKRANNGSHGLSSIYADTELYAQFRASYGTVLMKADEDFLISIAEDEEWAGFVPNVVNVLEEFSENVLKAIIKSVVVRYSCVLEYAFIPCIRVFGILKVDEILIDYLKNGTNNERKRVLGAFYFARPTILSYSQKTKTLRTFGYKHNWNKTENRYNVYSENTLREYQMTVTEFLSYCPIVGLSYFNRQKAYLEAFKENENRYMQLLFVSTFERRYKQFHSALKVEIKEYLDLKCERGISAKSEEFDKQIKIERGKEYFKTLFI